MVQSSSGKSIAPIIPQAPAGVPTSIEEVISKLFTFGITVGGIIFLILFLVGGIMYLSASGNEDQTGKAKRLMVDAIIGLILVLGAWAIATFVARELGAPGF